MPVRTFVALPLSEEILDNLAGAQRVLAAAGANVRWVARENLHVTVKFLGPVGEDRLGAVCDAAGLVGRQVEPFELEVRGISAVPPSGPLRMVWAGIADPTGRLERLQQAAEDAYAELGFERENRRFRPHLTLGRVKSGKNVARLRSAVSELAEKDFGTTAAEELVVFSSELKPKGPLYSALARLRLGVSASP